jgi:hypothetical protein
MFCNRSKAYFHKTRSLLTPIISDNLATSFLLLLLRVRELFPFHTAPKKRGYCKSLKRWRDPLLSQTKTVSPMQ